MTARFERSALALDIGAARGAWDAVSAFMGTVTAYVSGMEALRLDAVPIFGTTIDVFYNLPGLKQALAAAKAHTPGWQPLGMQLWLSILTGVTQFTPQLKAASEEITRTIAGATAAGRKLNSAELALIIARLRTLQANLKVQRDSIEAVKPRTIDYVRLITADYRTLTSGSQRIDEAIPAVEQATTAAALKFLSPESQGLMRMVIEAGGKIRNELVTLTAAVHALVTANDAAQLALQGTLTAWSAVDGKFNSVIKTLSETEQSAGTFEDILLLLDIAAESWQQLMTYISGGKA